MAQRHMSEASMHPAVTVAVLGAGGIMGLPMARNLARAGFAVRGWNCPADNVKPLFDVGIAAASSPAQAARGADVVLTVLADTDAVLTAMDGTAGAMQTMASSAIWLQMGTLGVFGTQRCAMLAAERGIGFVDAPVLGTRQPAQDGSLVVLASGPQKLRSWVQPVFDAVGQRTLWAGQAGAGSRLKLVTNSWVLAVIDAAAETIALAEGLDVDASLLLEAMMDSPPDQEYPGSAPTARSA